MLVHRYRHISHRIAAYLQAFVLAMPIFLGVIPSVSAAQLDNRSIQVSTAQLGAQASHSFIFDVATSAPLGSISFTYCANTPLFSDPCAVPLGLDTTNTTLANQTNNTSFTYNNALSNTNTIVVSRTAAVAATGPSSYAFTDIINPTTPGQTVFVRIATFASEDGTGPATDRGSVAFATADVFRVDAYVPPFLTFCAGIYVTLNCNSVTGNYIDIGELGSNRTATGMMQFSGATNDPTGYTTYLNGITMTSGNNVIDALATNAGSSVGTSQFGLNLRSNSNPSFGLEPIGIGASVPTPGYATPNSFRFVNGEAITNSSVATDFKIFTAAYIVNVPKVQPPGVYVTTMTYTAIASF